MERNTLILSRCASVLAIGLLLSLDAYAAKKKVEPVPLTAEGTKALAQYSKTLADLRAGLKNKLPTVGPAKKTAFLAAYAVEKGTIKKSKDKKGKVREELRNNTFNNAKATFASLAAAKPLLVELDGVLSSDSLDRQLIKCSVLASATPRGLAEFSQLGVAQKKLVDELLADTDLMKEMLYAGGAKAGRYGKAIEILRSIQAASDHAKKGHLFRLALGTSLEFAAPELCGYAEIDPVKRYLFFEKAYHDKELDSAFNKFTTWQYRQVVNDPQTEADMTWMREMLWNYRPDIITAPKGYRARYVGLMNTEFGHKRLEVDENDPATRIQQTINSGGQCGPKAFFGRCLNRSFGVPTWGARLRSHTAMTYWTPKGWTSILGVSWQNGFWTVDQPESMRAVVFRLGAMTRDYPEAYIKVCRAQWIGDALSEEKLDGMYSGTGGLWNALALNKMRATVMEKNPPQVAGKRPWELDSYAKDAPNKPEKMMTPKFGDADRKIVVGAKGTITIPAVACSSPQTNTDKILFMNSRNGGMQLHYKRFEQPEPFVYTISVAKAGSYALSANVVTVNKDQFFLLTVNGAKQPIEMKMPYTVGKWHESAPISLSLVKGKNTLSFTRTVPEDFKEKGWKYSGPQFGGVTIKSLTLKPTTP